MAVVVVFFYLYWGNVVLWLKRTSTKKLANRISYQIWYKGCLKGKFGRGVQICEGRSTSASGFGPGVQIRGGSKSAVTLDFVHLLLILSKADFFYQLHSCVCLCQGAFGWQPMTETSRYILPFSKNVSLSCSVCEGVGIVLAMTRVQKSVRVSDKHPLLRLVCWRFLMWWAQ